MPKIVLKFADKIVKEVELKGAVLTISRKDENVLTSRERVARSPAWPLDERGQACRNSEGAIAAEAIMIMRVKGSPCLSSC